MTNARLARVPRSDIDYASLSFNPDEPEPLPEAMYQYPILEEILPILGAHLNRLYSRETVFRGSNTFICYDPDNLCQGRRNSGPLWRQKSGPLGVNGRHKCPR